MAGMAGMAPTLRAGVGHVIRPADPMREADAPPIARARRGGRVVDRTALEMRSARKRTGGSNPSLSANSVVRHQLYQ